MPGAASTPATARRARVLALAAMVLSVLAITVFVVILLLGINGATEVGRIFGPIGIAATALGLVAAIGAVRYRETRAAAVVSLAILVPCALLAALNVVALLSAA